MRMRLDRYVPHYHSDDLGYPRRDGERAICGGCDRVVVGRIHASRGQVWWNTVLWPVSRYWRKRLSAGAE